MDSIDSQGGESNNNVATREDESELIVSVGSLNFSETSSSGAINIHSCASFELDAGKDDHKSPTLDMEAVTVDHSPHRQGSLEIDTGDMGAPPVKGKDEQIREHSSTLYNYLVLHHLNVLSDPHILFEFEALTVHIMEGEGDDHSPLRLLLVEHGWNGAKYKHSPSIAFDVHKLTQDLGTMYFVGKTSDLLKRELSANEGDMELYNECSLLQTFCPNIVIRNILASYNPENRVYSVGRDMEGGDGSVPLYRQAPASCSFFAACMLADISGFTKLSSAYCSKGSVGLDALHHVTETFLGDLVKTVYNFNGDVISFAGDALVCVFYDSNIISNGNGNAEDASSESSSCPRLIKSQRSCCSRALRCALQLAALETPELTTHIAISCGEMKVANLGGYNHEWVYLLNGPCMSALGSCVDEAKSREVVVTKDVLNLVVCNMFGNAEVETSSSPVLNVTVDKSTPFGLDICCTYDNTTLGNAKITAFSEKSSVVSLGSGGRRQHMLKADSAQTLLVSKRHNVKSMFDEDELDFIHSLDNMDRVEEVQDVILQYVPKPAAEAILCGYFELISELRQVTTVFIKLDSYSPELHLDPLCFQDLFVDIQVILAETGGFMRQFLVDDKGCVLIAMWGVPHFTFFNNGSRAICGAQMIQEACSDHGHRCSIGITTGTVFCGTVGSSIRRDYVAIGHTVNLAARLMCKSKGRIFVDETTYSLLPSAAKKRLLRSNISLVLKGVEGVLYPYIVQTQAELMSQSNAEGLQLMEFATIIQLSIVDHDMCSARTRDIKRDVDLILCGALDELLMRVETQQAQADGSETLSQKTVGGLLVPSAPASPIIEVSPRWRQGLGPRGVSINNSARDRVFAGSERAASALMFHSNSQLLKHLANQKSGGSEFWRGVCSESGEMPPILAMVRKSGGAVTHEIAHYGKIAGHHVFHVGETVAHELSHGISHVVEVGDAVVSELSHIADQAGERVSAAGEKVATEISHIGDTVTTVGGKVVHGISDAGKVAAETVKMELDHLVHQTEVTTKMAHRISHIASKGKHGISSIGKAAVTKGKMASKLFVGGFIDVHDSITETGEHGICASPNMHRSALASPISSPRGRKSFSTSPISEAGAVVQLDDIFADLNSLHPGERSLSPMGSRHVLSFVLQGSSGSGKSTSAFYFKRAATQRGLKCFWVTCRSENESVSYGVLREIFLELIGGKQEFVTELQQRSVLSKLLDLVYEDKQSVVALERKMDILTSILGLEWTDMREKAEGVEENESDEITADGGSIAHDSGQDLQAFALASRRRHKVRHSDAGKLFQRICSFHEDDVFKSILTYLFQQSPCAMVIEKAQFCDVLSWRVLKSTQSMQIQLVLLITVQSHLIESERTPHSMASSSTRMTKAKSDLLGAATGGVFNQESIVENVQSMSQDSGCRILELTPFNREEVGLLLQSVLDTPETLVKLGSFAAGVKNHLQTPNLVSPSLEADAELDAALAIITTSDELDEGYLHSVPSEYVDTPVKPGSNKPDSGKIGAGSVVTEELKDFVTKVCAGNPFWCKLMAQFIKDQGTHMFITSMVSSNFAPHDDDESSDRILSESALRGSDKNPLSAMIINRLESLKNTDQVVLKYASILSVSPDFKLELLCDIVPDKFYPDCDKVSKVKEVLHIAMGQGLVAYVSHDPPTYAFSNDLIRKTLYTCTPSSDAKKLHVIIAKKLCSLYEGELRSHYESLSDHYTCASIGGTVPGSSQKMDLRLLALEFSVKAADQALRYGGYENVLFFLQRSHKLAKFPLEFQVCADIIEIALEEIRANPHDQDISPALVNTFNMLLERVRSRSSSNLSMAVESQDELSISSFSQRGSFSNETSCDRPGLNWAPSFTMSKQTSKVKTNSLDRYSEESPVADNSEQAKMDCCCVVS